MCFMGGGSTPPPPPPEPKDEAAPPEYMITKKQSKDNKLVNVAEDVGIKQLQIDRIKNDLDNGSGLAIKR